MASDFLRSERVRFLPADKAGKGLGSTFQGLEIDSNIPCAGFSIIHESSDYINLLNKCDDERQFGISWSNSPEIMYYRLPARRIGAPYIARQIWIRGINGRIISAAPWNFNYGQDVTEDARIFETPMGDGDVLIGISNPSSLHMVFRVDVYEDGRFNGYAYGVTEKGQSETRVEARYSWENKRFIVRSAHLDPE